MKLQLASNDFILDGKALVWEKHRALVLADVHLGKNSYFQRHGMLIPEEALLSDLRRLSELMLRHRCQRMLVLGDLFHHERSFTQEFMETIAYWRAELPFEIILVEGNHDRRVQYPEDWGILLERRLDWDGFSFRHEWDEKTRLFQMAGHYHPALSLGRGPDRVRVPCFWLRDNGIVLPAFTDLTGHYNVRLAPNESALLVTPEGIMPYP